MTTLRVRVVGRPAPQGSHETGANGYVMHSSKYLAAWRHAVNRDTRLAYVTAGITPEDMPLIPTAPVYLTIEHVVLNEQCVSREGDDPTGSPDVDKLARATIDGLGEARVFSNDSQVVYVAASKRRTAPGEDPGAYITISSEPISQLADRGDQQMANSFTGTGQYRLVLEAVGTDGDGDRTWETLVEVTDSPEAIAQTWLTAVSARLGAEPSSEPAAAEAAKPTRKPRAKSTPAAPEAPAAAPEAPAPVPTVPADAPAPQAPAEAAPAAAPARVNPFAR